MDQFTMDHTMARIKAAGYRVNVISKAKALRKIGTNPNVDGNGIETIEGLGGSETYVSDNLINRISSSSTSDTEDMLIEGHTIDENGNFTFTVQTITLNGQTPVELPTSLARCTRCVNNNGSLLTGDVYIYQSTATVTNGVPAERSLTHITVEGSQGFNQSRKCSTTISAHDVWIITSFEADIKRSSSNTNVDFILEVRNKDGVFLNETFISLRTGSITAKQSMFDPPILVYPNSDVRVVAETTASNTVASAELNGYLARVIPT